MRSTDEGFAPDTVGHFMRRDFVFADASDSLDTVGRMMRVASLRHVPVVQGGNLVGTVSYRRLQDAWAHRVEEHLEDGLRRERRNLEIALWAENDPLAVDASCPLKEAVRRMLDCRVGYLPVVEGEGDPPRLIGILTEADLIRIAYERGVYGPPD